jgi:hypothetical protein
MFDVADINPLGLSSLCGVTGSKEDLEASTITLHADAPAPLPSSLKRLTTIG